MNNQYSDYIVYVDESGDHNLERINQQYPIFVLNFCIMKKIDYCNNLTLKMQNFKLQYFNHDLANLHEADIRKAKNGFEFLINEEIRKKFNEDLNNLIEQSQLKIISIIINKNDLNQKYTEPDNPYKLSLMYGL